MTESVATFETKIAPELTQWVRPITDATPHPKNIRKHNIASIARSLEAHGQRTPIVVQQSTGLIVKGNGTWEAAIKLGWTDLAQIWQDFPDETVALAYLAADNRASDRASYDREKTVDLLKLMVAGPGLFDTLWEMDELEDLIAEGGVPETPIAEFKGDYVDAGEVHDARAARGLKSGQKMKETPLVMTLEQHGEFMEQVQKLRKAYGTTGIITTVMEAVRREAAAGQEIIPLGDAEQVRQETLKAARDFFLTKGQQTYSLAEVAAFFQSAMRPLRPEVTEEPAVVEGQEEAFPTEAPVADELPEQLPALL